MTEHWAVVPEKTTEHWLQVRDPAGWYSAYVRWDGCIGFYRLYNNPLPEGAEAEQARWEEDDHDYLHICDLDDEIARLQALREAARQHFGPGWPHD